jgi:hypothetical protein
VSRSLAQCDICLGKPTPPKRLKSGDKDKIAKATVVSERWLLDSVTGFIRRPVEPYNLT